MTVSHVIPFPILGPPPPPQPVRPMLQPSLHPRGGRPYSYIGKIDDWHAPGAIPTKHGNTRCAVDSAWLVERVMGRPQHAPAMWPGVPGVRERALWAGQQLGLTGGQAEGAAFLAERDYAILADQPGAGKTAQAIVAAEARLSMAAIPDVNTPVCLIVCPAVVKHHWQDELKEWVGHDSVVLETLRPDPDVLCKRYVICNYDILYSGQKRDAAGVVYDVAHLPGWGATLAGRFLVVIFDEAHMLRGRQSRRTKAAKLMTKGVPVVWGLTGTPMPNFVRDLYSLVDVVSDGLFGFAYWPWAKAYAGAAQGAYGWSDNGSSRLEELQGRLGYFMIGRPVDMQLPEKRREVVRIDVEVSAPTVHEGRQALDRKQAVMSALRATANAKRPAVVNGAVEALEAKQKVIVFVYMRAQADAIAKDIRKRIDCTVFCVHGDLSPEGRHAQAAQFREASAPACFVATIDSMGVGLSLVGAHLMIFGDLVPEPWKMLQAEKRGHRFDSVVRLLVRYFIATGTVDEGIAEAVIAKIPVIEQTLGAQDDSAEMVTMLGGKSDEEIVGALFEKLKSWSATHE